MTIDPSSQIATVAYFSMEIAVRSDIPTYSGGLGILAGDTLRSAADLGIPMVAVTLIHRQGYFHQHLDPQGNQSESPSLWNPEEVLEPLPHRVSVALEGREVQVRAWRYSIQGLSGRSVPVYFLDTFLPENSPWDQTLTDHLYGGDLHYRLCQEAVLGFGGVALLQSCGLDNKATYHLNEGHSAFLAVSLLEQRLRNRGTLIPDDTDVETIRRHCVFTTHTPVPAGQDQFPWDLVKRVLGERRIALLEATQCRMSDDLNMTYLALRFSHYVNGVGMRHGEISHSMFPGYPINAITNGVHALTWTAPTFRELYDRHIPEWRQDNFYLRYAVGIPLQEIQQAHAQAKNRMLTEVQRRSGVRLNETTMTLGFARRAATYKRPDLLFSDLKRLRDIAGRVGPLQVIYGGKAHPRDEGGKAMVRHVFEAATALRGQVQVLYLENYDMTLGQILTAGVDVWLNTPLRPQEASGTSGMKAALNGVPSLSILDGWWIEGHVENVTGWAIGDGRDGGQEVSAEIDSLYDKLEWVILPMFYGRPTAFAEMMRSTIALNAAFFNTQRMVSQYLTNAYSPNQTRA